MRPTVAHFAPAPRLARPAGLARRRDTAHWTGTGHTPYSTDAVVQHHSHDGAYKLGQVLLISSPGVWRGRAVTRLASAARPRGTMAARLGEGLRPRTPSCRDSKPTIRTDGISQRLLVIIVLLLGSSSAILHAAEERVEPVNLFVGHYPYTVAVPHGYAALPKLKDKNMEFVYFIRESTKPPRENLEGEWNYARQGTVRLDVEPKYLAMRAGMSVEEVCQRAASIWRQRGEEVAVKDVPLAYPACQLTVTSPYALVQVLVEGQQVLYSFISGDDSATLRALVTSLKEIGPSGEPLPSNRQPEQSLDDWR